MSFLGECANLNELFLFIPSDTPKSMPSKALLMEKNNLQLLISLSAIFSIEHEIQRSLFVV